MFKHVKNLIRIFIMSIITLPVELSAYIIVPIVLLFVSKDDNNLPTMFSWYDDWKYGINGDPYWQGSDHAGSEEKARTYWWRVKWLTRNKATTFFHNVVGVKIDPAGYINHYGDPATEDQPLGHSGWQYIEYHKDGKMWPCYYFVYQYGNSSKCLRAYWGWKLKDYYPDMILGAKGRPVAMFSLMTFNPFKSFKK